MAWAVMDLVIAGSRGLGLTLPERHAISCMLAARAVPATFRHREADCVVCGGQLHRAGTGRRRLFCGAACRQRAYRLRVEARAHRDRSLQADPAEVTRLLTTALSHVGRR